MKKNIVNQFQIETFLERFFTAHQCDITKEKDGHIAVQLTVEMDKVLMNRPFYWQYIEATGNVGTPKKLHFVTNPKEIDNHESGEWIHFGSPRLTKIYEHLRKTAKFTQVYESLNVTKNTMLHPWLLINVCIMYEGKQKKEELFSIGLNLINGAFVFDMMNHLEKINLKPHISNYCYTVSPLIKLSSGFLRIEKYLNNYIASHNHAWALESMALLREEIDMIYHFYENEENVEEMQKEIEDISGRLQPKITFEVINGGIIHLAEDFIQDHIS